MARLAVVGGHSIDATRLLASGERIEAPGGVAAIDAGDAVVLQRHGLDGYRAPHAIDHEANLAALVALGCDRVLAIGSVGSLHRELAVGTMLAPDDFVAFHTGASIFDDERGHRVPGFDGPWRAAVVAAWPADAALRDGGVYWQTPGPRLETAAEIRLIAAHADVVGMTIGSECVVAGELGLAYAAVCVVDNLANGIGAQPLAAAEIERGAAANRDALDAALSKALPALSGERR